MIEIVAAKKDKLADEDAVRVALGKMRPNKTIETITDKGENGWVIRLADKPPFLQDKEEESPDEEATESPDEEKAEDKAEGDSGDSKSKGDKKDGDPVKEVKGIIDQLNQLLGDLGGKTQELQDSHQEKQDKLDEISDTVGDGEKGGLPGLKDEAPLPPDVGPTPGGPPGAAPGGPPRPPARPGIPSGKRPIPAGPSAFSKRRTEIVRHAGVDEKTGDPVSLLEAATALETDSEWADYKIVGMTENSDGSFSAKLRLR